MNLELIPVIELHYYNEKIESPEGNSFEFPNEWDKYNDNSFIAAGFKDKFLPYEPGSWLFKLNEITESNLTKIIEYYFEEFESDEPITDDHLQPLDGGYILKANNRNLIYPQCCGNLGDIESWEGITNPKSSYFWNGHPTPIIIQKNSNVVFDLTEMNKKEISIDRGKLKTALIETNKQLSDFAKRINGLEKNYGIKDLGNKLIFN